MNKFKIELEQEIESVKNRPDKTILKISSMHPEKFLVPEVSHPEQVKHLTLDLGIFDICDDYQEVEKYLHKVDCDCVYLAHCNKCSWNIKYTDTLCKDLVNFTQLETAEFTDVNLSDNLWVEFAQNSKCLKKIEFNSCGDLDSGLDLFFFNGGNPRSHSLEPKNKALDAIVKIPTLETIKFSCLELRYFPPGPSNLKHIELDSIKIELLDNHKEYKTELAKCYESYASNLCTHTNITSLYICFQFPIKFSTFQLHKFEHLKELSYIGDKNLDDDDCEDLKAILKLPKFHKLKIFPINF